MVLTRGADGQLALSADGRHHVRGGEGGGAAVVKTLFKRFCRSLHLANRQARMEGRERRRGGPGGGEKGAALTARPASSPSRRSAMNPPL